MKNYLNLLSFFMLTVAMGAILQGCTGETKTPLQKEVEVPFTAQAPQGNWAEPWQNACEETSIIMIDNFYEGDELTREKAREEILKIFEVKEEIQGESKDESMETVSEIINAANLNWTVEIKNEPTLDEMKATLAEDQPIIAPVYAPKLQNPHYEGGGPDYHVVVIVGYDDQTQEFIVHDPGTSSGESLRFNYDLFYNAIHDFLTTRDYTAGEKRVLFTKPK